LGKYPNTVALPRRGNCYSERCPTREVLDHVFSRWGVLVLGALRERRSRYSELRRRIGGISEKMLAQTLRQLERDGLVERIAFDVVPPHVEYRLTPYGRECAERAFALIDWIETHVRGLMNAQAAYDAAAGD
jgi:DNA-binding HxlR family transcriptional regulator